MTITHAIEKEEIDDNGHVYNWIQLFVLMYNNTITSRKIFVFHKNYSIIFNFLFDSMFATDVKSKLIIKIEKLNSYLIFN